MPIIYNLRHLRKLLHIKKSEQERFFGKDRQQSYNKFNIPKKSGGVRIIEAPVNDLKAIQKWIKDNILDKFEASKYAKGFIKNISIYDNALPHVNKELVINLDLKDFFPSIDYSQVFKIFKYFGYDLSKPLNELPLSADDYQTLEHLCFILTEKLKKLFPMRYREKFAM